MNKNTSSPILINSPEQSPFASGIPSISIQGVTKSFSSFHAVNDVSLDIHDGEFFSLLGSSGCGKTTLLRMIAGFETPSTGKILLQGNDVTMMSANERPVNLVFQHYALFPHLSVAKNIGFGLKYQDVSRVEASRRIAAALELVQLNKLENRLPAELSGGQKQRVALARALVLRPKVLLLDEPLGALDQKLRKEMQVELKNLQKALGITFIFVTHDQEEAMTMSDRIAVMNAGKVEQCDAAVNVFEFPQTQFVAEFMGAGNILSGTVVAIENASVVIESSGEFKITIPAAKCSTPLHQTLRFIVRPEKLALLPNPGNSVSIPVTIDQRIYQGLSTTWIVKTTTGKKLSIFEQNTKPFFGDAFKPGDRAFACFDSAHTVILQD